MVRPRKGDKCVDESSYTRARPTNMFRTSHPRATKLNRPNYKIDLEEDEMAFGAPTRQRKPQTNKSLDLKEGEARTIRKIRNDRGKEASRQVHNKLIGTIFSWLIDMEYVNERDMVQIIDTTCTPIGSGELVRDGISCNCCNKVFRVVEFGAHRGDATITSRNIFVPNRGSHLYDILIEALDELMVVPSYGGYNNITSKQGSSDRSDDTCVICADGGNLICCSACPSTYHQSCLNLQATPSDDWKCQYCRCKYCQDLNNEERILFTCSQCEKKYHMECFGGDDLMSFDLNVSSANFCGSACSQIYFKLKAMLGVKKSIDQDLSWTLLKRIDKESVSYTEDGYNTMTSNCKVAVAARVMEECFEPIVDRYTKINMIRSIAFNSGSNFPRINYTGFYTAILESKEEEIVTVASIRIHGPKLAEMPFIATSDNWRCKGMCRAMLTAIESALRDIGVEYLYIPSAPEMVSKWISSFGFENMSEDVRNEIINTNCLMFLTTTSLQKKIRRHGGLNFLPDLNL